MPDFASTGLDVVIGLSFVFLTVSLIASSVREAIAAVLNSRAARLEDAITKLLRDPDLARRFYENPLVEQMSTRHSVPGRNKKVGSYLPSRTFALALVDTLRHDQAPPDEVARAQRRVADAKETLRERSDDTAARQELRAAQDALAHAWANARVPADDQLAHAWRLVLQLPRGALRHQAENVLQDAGNDINKLRAGFENVYDEAMERVSGWYKRRSQLIIIVVAILIAGFGNVDAIAIASRLWKDPTVRASVVATAQNVKTTDTQDYASSIEKLKQLQLPVGWSHKRGDPRTFPDTTKAVIGKIVGILITALAALLGAPFWFSALSRLAPLRATGAKPATTARNAPTSA
jgi:hypothetical protein